MKSETGQAHEQTKWRGNIKGNKREERWRNTPTETQDKNRKGEKIRKEDD